MKYSLFTLFALLLMFTFVGNLNAQFGISDQDINVSMSPENPGPNQDVYVSLTSYITDINNASIAWSVNGKTVENGRGIKSFTFKTGNINITTTLSVTVRTAEGETITRSFRIRPSTVDLIWYSHGYTPPFYKGKSLYSHQNKITFVAIPHITSSNGQEISAKTLLYTWRRNGSVMESASGYGKSSMTITGSLISRPIDIEVQVSAPTIGSVAKNSTAVTPIEPSVFLYEKNPLYGIGFQRVLRGTEALNNTREISVIGIPYFYGTTNSSAPELTYKWSINGVSVNNDPKAMVQVFRQKEGTSGTSNISLTIENTSKILQFASTNFNLVFGNSNLNTSQ